MSAMASVNYLPYLGRSLSTSERTALQCSLPLLAHRCNAPVTAVQWWGKVCGYRADYHIACIRHSGSGGGGDGDAADAFFASATYFYSVDDGNTWNVLPHVTPAQAQACERLRGVFRGVPTFEYRLRDVVQPLCTEQAQMHTAALAGGEATAEGVHTSTTSQLPPADAVLSEVAAAVRDAAVAGRRVGTRAADEPHGRHGNGRDDEDGRDAVDDGEDDDDDDNENDTDADEEEDDEAAAAEAQARAAEQRRLRKAAMQPRTIIVSVREMVRLAHFVQLHDASCRLLVRGEYLCPRDVVVALTDKDGGRHDRDSNNNNNNNSSDVKEGYNGENSEGRSCDAVIRQATRGVRNRNFAGQPLQHALSPACYLKAASYGNAARNATLYGETYNVHTDYLSPISDDVPADVWTLKYDATQNVVALRNLWFDGALFCYRPGTTERYQVYYGDGQRVLDLCFTL